MRKIRFQIVALFYLTFANASAQEAIHADKAKGCDSLLVQFTIVNVPDIGTSTAVVWDYGDGSTETGPLSMSHTYSEPGVYDVHCFMQGVFDITETKLVSVGVTPYADIKFKLTDITGAKLEYSFENQHFNGIPGIDLSYLWRFTEGIDTTEVYTKSALYYIEKNDTCYAFLKITDELGCESPFDSVMVLSSDSLLVPNVFSPNGDGENDFFTVSTSGDENWNFYVFTPDGLQVFASKSAEIIWNGRTIADREVPVGVYYYVIIREENTKEIYKGFVYLFR